MQHFKPDFSFQYEEIVHAYEQIGIPSSGPATPLYGRIRPRNWVPERDGLIRCRQDFDSFAWPDPDRSRIMAMANVFDRVTGDQAVQESLRFLSPGMKLILQTDGIFERFTKLMGLETFSFLLYDDPALVEATFLYGRYPIIQ